MAFFKSYRYVTAAQQTFLPLSTSLFDALFLSVTSFSIFMVALYWIFLRSLNFRTIGQWGPENFQTMIGYHFGLIMVLPEIFLSCNMIIKIQASFPPIAIVLYIFLVWITHYLGGWDWPLPIFPVYFEKDFHFMYLAGTFAVIMLATTLCCMLVYSMIQLREIINSKTSSMKQ
jgi:hypothetical protein